MFQARLVRHKLFIRIIESILLHLDEVNVVINPEGVFIDSIDESKASMINLVMPSQNFDEFVCGTKGIRIGIPIRSLYKVLRLASEDDTMLLRLDDDPTSLRLEYAGEYRHMNFDLTLLTCDSDFLGAPHNRPSAYVTLPSLAFSRMCRELSCIDEIAKFKLRHKQRDMVVTIVSDSSFGKICFRDMRSISKEFDTAVKVSKSVC
jgi:proliferating cell nuclear antigen PCNA